MKLKYPRIKEIIEKEEELRDKVLKLTDEERKTYYKSLSDEIKDPDTYAVLNYFFTLGLHHLYVGKIKAFLQELLIILISLVLIFSQCQYAIYTGFVIFSCVSAYQIFQLFLSQRIIRHLNFEKSQKKYDEIINKR